MCKRCTRSIPTVRLTPRCSGRHPGEYSNTLASGVGQLWLRSAARPGGAAELIVRWATFGTPSNSGRSQPLHTLLATLLSRLRRSKSSDAAFSEPELRTSTLFHLHRKLHLAASSRRLARQRVRVFGTFRGYAILGCALRRSVPPAWRPATARGAAFHRLRPVAQPLVAADATRVSSPTFSRLASTSSGFAQQPGRVAPLNS